MNGTSLDKNGVALIAEPTASDVSGEETPENTLLGKEKELFVADRLDGIFALAAFVLGFLFARWVLFSWQGWGVTLFTLSYCGAVALYLLKKGTHISRVGWFWLAIVILTGISFCLWNNNGLAAWRALLLFGSAVYWIICATGVQILGKTSNLALLDGFNALLLIPFSNINSQYRSLALLGRNKRTEGRQILSIALGLFLALVVAVMVMPLLMKADSGGFAKIISGLLGVFSGISQELGMLFWHGLLAIPIAAYLFGLVAGSVHKKGTDLFQKNRTLSAIAALRVLPLTTVYILLGLLCLLYVVFIGSQLPYFFSAFTGERPEGWQVYSEYARSGFFELCRIAAINLIVLTVANIFSSKPYRDHLPMKVLNALLAILTLVLISTAFSKMAMYIGAYGLSMRRMLPCIFMIFMAVICGGVIALQKWSFSIMRMSVVVGVIMLCLLCMFDPDSFVTRYNAERYLAGTLESFDVDILNRAGPAGVDSALMVYRQSDDPVLQEQLEKYLLAQQHQAEDYKGTTGDNLQLAHIRQQIAQQLSTP